MRCQFVPGMFHMAFDPRKPGLGRFELGEGYGERQLLAGGLQLIQRQQVLNSEFLTNLTALRHDSSITWGSMGRESCSYIFGGTRYFFANSVRVELSFAFGGAG
jgi:hypothetical protein